MRVTFYALVLGLMASLPACSDRASEPSGQADATVSSKPRSADAKIQVSMKSRQEIRELIESHSGDVVVLDLWALW